MVDARELTRVDAGEIELASNETLYCIVTGGGRQVIVGTEIFRSKDGKNWEKWVVLVCSCGREFKTRPGLLSHLRANKDHYNSTIGPPLGVVLGIK